MVTLAPADEVTVYEVTGLPPWLTGGHQATYAKPLPARAAAWLGASGTPVPKCRSSRPRYAGSSPALSTMDDGAWVVLPMTWLPATVTLLRPVSLSPICHQLPSTSIGPLSFNP